MGSCIVLYKATKVVNLQELFLVGSFEFKVVSCSLLRCNAKQGQPNDQTHDILGRQLAPPDRDLARVLKNVLNNYWIDQIAESA